MSSTLSVTVAVAGVRVRVEQAERVDNLLLGLRCRCGRRRNRRLVFLLLAFAVLTVVTAAFTTRPELLLLVFLLLVLLDRSQGLRRDVFPLVARRQEEERDDAVDRVADELGAGALVVGTTAPIRAIPALLRVRLTDRPRRPILSSRHNPVLSCQRSLRSHTANRHTCSYQLLVDAIEDLDTLLQVEHFVERDVLCQEPNRRVRLANL